MEKNVLKKFFIINLFSPANPFFLSTKAIWIGVKEDKTWPFVIPALMGLSVHNSIYECVKASMWKHRSLRDIKPFPLNIIWPFRSHSQKKAYACICWKSAPSRCAAESLLVPLMLHGDGARKWHLYRIWGCNKWVEGTTQKWKSAEETNQSSEIRQVPTLL